MRPRFDYRALGRLPRGTMNKTEALYAAKLELEKRTGLVVWYKFEGLKLKLADKTYYTPDFVVLNHAHELELHEVKGFMMDDANVKLKVSAAEFPFTFKVARYKRKQWEITEV